MSASGGIFGAYSLRDMISKALMALGEVHQSWDFVSRFLGVGIHAFSRILVLASAKSGSRVERNANKKAVFLIDLSYGRA
jgi:hypothetical protein